ncbi:MAG: polysaccharide deacetylase family protein [Fimbriimonadaceae bacterium]
MRVVRVGASFLALFTAASLPQGVSGSTNEGEAIPGMGVPYLPVKPLAEQVSQGNPNVYAIALTFDDGPHAGYTERLLDLLGKENVVATHFLIGRNVRNNPELTQRIALEGHEVANHSMNHIRSDKLSGRQLTWEIARATDEIEKAAGVRPAFFRPPGGTVDSTMVEISNSLGQTVALWTSSAGDFTSNGREPTASQITDRVLASAEPGAIVILHDPMEQTLVALPEIVRRLREKGFYFVTMSQLAAMPGAVTSAPKAMPSPKPTTVRPLLPEGPSR